MSGKFFDMPKGMKTAPPQQSSLQDMWGKKKAKPAAAPKPEGDMAEAAEAEETMKQAGGPPAEAKSAGTPRVDARAVG
jgi:DNA ligase-1